MPERILVRGALLLLAGGISCAAPSGTAPPDDPPGVDPSGPTGEVPASELGGLVSSVDIDGRPRFIWAKQRVAASPGLTVEDAAREHFARFAPSFGIRAHEVAEVAATPVGNTRGGDHIIRLGQKVDGIEVYRSEVKVVMRSDLSLVAITGTPAPAVAAKPAASQFALTPGQALGRALSHLYRAAIPDAATSSLKAAEGPYTWLDLPSASSVKLSEPARAKKVFVPVGDALVPAYFIEFFSENGTGTGSDAYRYVVAADDGRVLDRRNLTADVAFSYRVYADSNAEGRPVEGPQANFTPHPRGIPDNTNPAFVPASLVTAETIKSEPPGAIDPWLAQNAVQTLGNNVDAYADIFAPDGFSNGDLRATPTALRVFDHQYDLDQEPGNTTTQRMAATTNLFYTINWLHDYWYDSGFTEAAANAQMSNFGRGGEQSDPIRAEAQDFGGLNNANMSTPSDGLQPRMQMFLWGPPSDHGVEIEASTFRPTTGFSNFGPVEFNVTGQLVLVNDGDAAPTDACQPITNDISGRIALVDRSAVCGFTVRAQNVEAAGGIGMIAANDVAGPPPALNNTNPPTLIGIPSLGVPLRDGNSLKALLASGPVTVRIFRELTGAGRDGSLDNMIIGHEWGHYFHHRLSDCGGQQCGAQSEGWGDFIGLHTILREGDNLDGTYGMSIYGPKVLGDSGYFGIRRLPYSVDFTKNALTFRHIQNAATLPTATPMRPNANPNSQVHNAGTVWASMLWEAYIALHKNPAGRTFAQVRRAFSDYLVLGLKLAPVDSTYIETRDSILAAALMTNPADVRVIANAFARRGAGSCAVGPPRTANGDLSPVTESFEVRAKAAVASIESSDDVDSCDLDGTLDAGETGRVRIEVANVSPLDLVNTRVTLSTRTRGVSFPSGTSAVLARLAPFATETVEVEIALDESFEDVGLLDLNVTVQNLRACVPFVVVTQTLRINADEAPQSGRTETVEAAAPPWSKTGVGAEGLWTRNKIGVDNHAWHAAGTTSSTDTQLVTPPLVVSATENFRISFEHAFSFEVAQNQFFDGGVIELSADNGVTWQDVSSLVDPGYTQVLANGNPMVGRRAYAGQSAAFPAMVPVSLDLGSAFAGRTVLLRFRVGTDIGGSAPGWTIDNIAFEGITNTPFTMVVPHGAVCQEPPIANAGRDRTVASGADVILDASATTDPNGDPIAYLWTQTAGPAVALFNANSAHASFKAPTVQTEQVLAFRVQASDEIGSTTATVRITVRP